MKKTAAVTMLAVAVMVTGCSSAVEPVAPSAPVGIANVPTESAEPSTPPAPTAEPQPASDIERLRAELEPMWSGTTPLDDENVQYIITNACQDAAEGRQVWVVNAETEAASEQINAVIASAAADYLCD